MAFRNCETVGKFLERNGAYRFQALRCQPRQPQLRGNRHGEATRVRGSQQFFGIGALPLFKSRPIGILRARKHSAGSGDLSLPRLQITAPLSVRCTFHVIRLLNWIPGPAAGPGALPWMQPGYPGKQEN